MTGHIEQIRQRYDQFSRGDIRGATQDWADDFVWEGGNSAELPMGGTHYGKAAALQVLAHDVAVWDEFTMSADEYFEAGDTVVVLGHSALRKDGQSATTTFVHIWRWRGDQISRFLLVTDTLQLAQMLGLAASGTPDKPRGLGDRHPPVRREQHMPATADNGNIVRRVAEGTPNQALDVLGPTIEFLTRPDAQGSFCVMRGLLPPGMTVPLHSHDDAEDFLVLTGTHQVLTQGAHGLEWADAHAGDYVHIPAGTPHAHRNTSPDPAIDLIITTARLGRFCA